MDMTERKRRILRAVVELYVETAEPVGSKTLAQMPGFGFSSATIRNEMSDLEALGYLEQPHTSAGRIPSAKGYRFYVNELMNAYRLSVEEAEHMRRAFQAKLHEIDKMVSQAGRMISSMTHFPVYALAPTSAQQATIRRFDLIPVDERSFIIVVMTSTDSVQNKLVKLPFTQRPEDIRSLGDMLNNYFTGCSLDDLSGDAVDRCVAQAGRAGTLIALVLDFARQVLDSHNGPDMFLTGASNLLNYPEFHDVSKARQLMDFLTEENSAKLPAPEGHEGVRIIIGPENVAEELRNSSVVVVSYDIGGGQKGILGVVGPTRMDYAKVAASLSYIAEGMKKMFTTGLLPPPEE